MQNITKHIICYAKMAGNLYMNKTYMSILKGYAWIIKIMKFCGLIYQFKMRSNIEIGGSYDERKN